MSANAIDQRLDAVKRDLESLLRSQGVAIPRYSPAPAAPAARAIDADHAVMCAEMDRAMGLDRLAPASRLEGATLRCGIFPASARATTQPRIAPTSAPQRPAAQRPAADPDNVAMCAEMDRAMGLDSGGPAVRMEGARQVFSVLK